MRKAILFLLILTIPLVMAESAFEAEFNPISATTEDYCSNAINYFLNDLDDDFPIYRTNVDLLDICDINVCEEEEYLSELANFVETDIISDCSDYLADQDTLGIYCADKETGDLSEPKTYAKCLEVGYCSDESSTSREDCLASLFISDLGTSEDWSDIVEDDSHSFRQSRDISFGDDFYKEKFNDIIDSTWAFEFQASGSPDYHSTVDFAISHALSDEGYCISSEKIDTFFGEKYIVFLENDTYDQFTDGGFYSYSNPKNVGLKAGDINPTSLVHNWDSTRFHNINSHLSILGASTSGTLEEKCERLESIDKSILNTYASYGSNYFYPGFNVSGITTTTTWPWETLQRGQNTITFPDECPNFNYQTPNGQTNKHACGKNILWSMKSYDSNDVTGSNWRGNTFGSKYTDMSYEYKTPSDASAIESEYEWTATNEIIYSRINNEYFVEEAIVENSNSSIQTLLDDLGLDRIFAFAPTLDVQYKFNFEPCSSLSTRNHNSINECAVVTQMDYFGIKGDSIVDNFDSEGTYGIKGMIYVELQNSTKDIPFHSTFDMGEIEVTNTYVGISTNLESTNVAPDQDFTFTLQGISLSGKDIGSFFFDPGQREVPNGIYTLTASGDFECSETSGVVCSGHTSYFDASIGKGKGNPCACQKSDSGSGNVYAGQKSGTSTEALFQPYFDGESFEYEFNMNYRSKTSCGPDRVCQGVLEITDTDSN